MQGARDDDDEVRMTKFQKLEGILERNKQDPQKSATKYASVDLTNSTGRGSGGRFGGSGGQLTGRGSGRHVGGSLNDSTREYAPLADKEESTEDGQTLITMASNAARKTVACIHELVYPSDAADAAKYGGPESASKLPPADETPGTGKSDASESKTRSPPMGGGMAAGSSPGEHDAAGSVKKISKSEEIIAAADESSTPTRTDEVDKRVHEQLSHDHEKLKIAHAALQTELQTEKDKASTTTDGVTKQVHAQLQLEKDAVEDQLKVLKQDHDTELKTLKAEKIKLTDDLSALEIGKRDALANAMRIGDENQQQLKDKHEAAVQKITDELIQAKIDKGIANGVLADKDKQITELKQLVAQWNAYSLSLKPPPT